MPVTTFRNDDVRLLAIETSGTTCGVAYAGNKSGLVLEYSLFGEKRHDELLAEIIRLSSAELGIGIDRLTHVAVSAGPGSFTGLRIGLALAKALCFEGSPALVLVPTLAAYAYAGAEIARLMGAERIVAVLPSHAQFHYRQCFDAAAEPVAEVELVAAGDLGQGIAGNSLWVGPSAAAVEGVATASGLQRATPRFTARLGMAMALAGNTTDANGAEPLYHQDFVPVGARVS